MAECGDEQLVGETVADAAEIAAGLWAAAVATKSRPELERLEQKALEGRELLFHLAVERPEYREPLLPVIETLLDVRALVRNKLAMLVAEEALRDRRHPIRLALRRRSGWRREQRRAARALPSGSINQERPRQRPRERRDRRTRSSAGSCGEPESDPPRACEVCGKSLAGKYANAKTCGPKCRKTKSRRSKDLQPSAELLQRHEAALAHVGALEPDERLDLLAAVVWPEDFPAFWILQEAA
jgi:hypothetical protein